MIRFYKKNPPCSKKYFINILNPRIFLVQRIFYTYQKSLIKLEFEEEKVMLELKQLFNHIIKNICGLT